MEQVVADYKNDWFKERYFEAREYAYISGQLDRIKHNTGVYTFEMLQALRLMAENDIYPDWRFGDNECNVWEMFKIGAH